MGEIETNEVEVMENTCEGLCYTELEGLGIPEGFAIKDEKEVEFNGTPDQIAEMLSDYSKYFEEVTNPENSATNPFFKSKYSPLHAVLNILRPVLGKYGFGVLQAPKIGANGAVQVQTILTHRSGAMISFPSLEAKPPKPDVQSVISMVTYLRRASIGSILGVCGEPDDDGDSNNPKGKKAPAPKVTPLTPEQSALRKELIQLCADLTAKDKDNKAKILKTTGDFNSLKTVEEFNHAIEAVNGLGL